MTTATESRTEPIAVRQSQVDTGPQAVLELHEQGLDQRTIAKRLHISQPTVTRRIREAIEARQARHRTYAIVIMCTLCTFCMVVLTVAVSSIAWG